MDELAAFANRLARITEPAARARIATKAAEAARRAAVSAGHGQRMSRLKGARGLSAETHGGGDTQTVELVPPGEWVLMSEGRRSNVGTIAPTRAPALSTPWGPRATVRGSTSRGNHVIDRAHDEMERDAPRAAAEQWHTEIARVV